MKIRGTDTRALSINLDANTVLHIAVRRNDGNIVVMTECCQVCSMNVHEFETVDDLCKFYHINNSDLQDSINRVIDFIDNDL